MPKTTISTAGYDDDGNMTVYELALDETLPRGVHPKPPPGTHPHERELAAAELPMPNAAVLSEAVVIEPEPVKRGPGRPPKPRP